MKSWGRKEHFLRPEILTSGRGVRRWEWVTLGDEFGGGKLVSTAQTQAPGPGHRERKYPSFAKSWYFSDFSKYFRFPLRCPLSYWAMMPSARDWGRLSPLLHTRHFFLSWVHIPDSPPHNGHNLFVASDPGEKIKLYFCVNTGCGMRCCPLQSSFFTWLIPVIRSGESRQGRAGAGGSGSHFLALTCVWPSSARVTRLRPPPTRGRTHTVTLCWRIFK